MSSYKWFSILSELDKQIFLPYLFFFFSAQVTPSYTVSARPHRSSGAPGRGWWSTAEASSPPRWGSPWQTPCSAPRTSSRCSTPYASTSRECCSRPARYSRRPAFSEARTSARGHRKVALSSHAIFFPPDHWHLAWGKHLCQIIQSLNILTWNCRRFKFASVQIWCDHIPLYPVTVHQTATPTSDLKAVPLPQINDTQEHIILNEALARPPESHSDTQHLTAHNEHSSESSNCPHTESLQYPSKIWHPHCFS